MAASTMSSTDMSKEKLLELVESEAQDHIALLQSLIRSPTPNPPGNTKEAITLVQKYLNAAGIASKVIAPNPECPNLVAVLHGEASGHHATERSIILNGHIDQFPVPDATQWHRNPYSGDLSNGYIHGRSGVDMKAGTAASIIAFTYLHRFRAHFVGRCTLQVVSDEETGGRWGTKYLLDNAESAGDCVFIGEPSGLESVRFGEKGTLRMDFTVTAPAAHGAYTHRSEGAIRIAARLIARLVEMEKTDFGMDEALKKHMQRPDVRKVADEIMWPGAADAMLYPSVNIGTIEGGAKINMIPSECTFAVDIRIPIGVKSQSIRTHIDKVLSTADFASASYTVREDHSHEATHSDPTHELVGLLQENAKTVGKREPLAICSLGATDCKHFRSYGVPAFAYGTHPRGMAERDEKVSVEEFLEVVRVHTLTAWDYLGGSA